MKCSECATCEWLSETQCTPAPEAAGDHVGDETLHPFGKITGDDNPASGPVGPAIAAGGADRRLPADNRISGRP